MRWETPLYVLRHRHVFNTFLLSITLSGQVHVAIFRPIVYLSVLVSSRDVGRHVIANLVIWDAGLGRWD